ncbi:MAG TPA: N-acetylneuraminate synthase family protein [Vicinamibacteria bacterium]|nr:N-acetylneuraminate synthase family protein [Vicinamibacteria bacterium]
MTRARVRIGDRWVGEGEPTFVIAEIGINHNGSLELARKLIDGAVLAGADAVKFQKRTPEICVPPEQWTIERETPWGRMTYIDYRRRMELGRDQFAAIDRHCRDRGIFWFASCWDEPAVEFMEGFEPPCYKVASASLTDHDLLRRKRATGRPVILSTGMSTMAEIEDAVAVIGEEDLLVAHATSSYPCPVGDLNLRMMDTLRRRFPQSPIGYSGHETGLATTWAAVALGATFVERHITLDRAMWGSDQAASVEVGGFMRLVAQIRDVERALGDGIKRIYAGEIAQMEKLRRFKTAMRAAS